MNPIPTYNLMLNTLEEGCPGISEAWGKFLCEASTLCFESQSHPRGIELKVHGSSNCSFKVHWENDIPDQARNAWDDKQELTEYGACGVAVLLILRLTDFTVIRRARKGTGVDYWLAHKNTDKLFQDAARLEVSGIMNGDANAIKARVNRKRKQTQLSDGVLPAFIVVVEFSKPESHLVQK